MTIGTLAALASRPDMPSEVSLRTFIRARPDFPAIRRGRFGLSYQLDLEEAAAFVRSHWHDRRCKIVTLDPTRSAPGSSTDAVRNADERTTPTGTLAELGAVPGMPSLPSLRRFIAAHPDFPIVQRGRYGQSYRLDLDEAAAFVRAHWRDGRRLSLDAERELATARTLEPTLPGFEADGNLPKR